MRVRALLSLLLTGGLLAAGAAPASAATPPGPVDDGLDACPASRLLDPQFADVTQDNVFRHDIWCIENYGVAAGKTVATGTQKATYAPGDVVLRAQMALFVWNFLDGAGKAPSLDSPDHGFVDIPSSLPTLQKQAINALADAGILHGRDQTHFDPGGVVRRDQMATFLVNAQAVIDSGYSTTDDYFTDDANDAHQANINAIAFVGITAGCAAGPTSYCPTQPVTRAQMAGFLARDLERNMQRLNFEPVFAEDQQYRVRPAGDVAQPLSGAQRYAFDVVPGQTYDVALFPCANVTNGSSATSGQDSADPFTDVFRDADGNGTADGLGTSDHGGAHITDVNGTAVSGTATSQFGVTPTSGANQVTVTVTSATADCTVPVLFVDAHGDQQLALNGVDQPTDLYSAAAELSWS